MEQETIGARLRRLRLAAGLSQRQLANPGLSYAYISRLEADTRTPSMKVLRQLAPRLGVDVGYLETGGHENNPMLAVWFTPGAIRDHFQDDEGPVAEWVAAASDDDLAEVGEECIGADSVWRLFHEMLTAVVEEQLEDAPTEKLAADLSAALPVPQ